MKAALDSLSLPRSVPLRALVRAALADVAGPDAGGSSLVTGFVEDARTAGLFQGAWQRRFEMARLAPAPEDEPLASLARALGLSALEELTLALLVCLDEDAATGRVLAELQHPVATSRPTIGFLSVAFGALVPKGAGHPAHLLVGGPAAASGAFFLPRESRDGRQEPPLAERTLALPLPLSLALRGRDSAWPGASIGLAEEDAVPLPPAVHTEAVRQARALTMGKEGTRLLVIRTGAQAEGKAAATLLAEATRRRPVFFESGADSFEGIGPWLLARRLLPVFVCELGPGEHRRLPPLGPYDGPVLALAGPEGWVEESHARGAGSDWTLPIPTPAERAELWRFAVGPGPLADELGTSHRHGAGRIAELGRLVRHHAAKDGSASILPAHVRAATGAEAGLGLAGLAQPLPEPIPEDALVTSAPLRQELAHLLLRCQSREGLVEELGVSVKTRYRPGVRALFVGPSGTGKTLAAGWLATRLGLPLYRVDLASVTSKYIGETEKNLAKLLARAEHAEVVLLFDEADSLFGKRTDVKDANDRFANAQTNYLLQRIESFDGITILTSNSRTRFDQAFARRLDAILDFALPGPEERRGLWLSHLGAGHALGPRTINKLAASVDLAGGHIRNVVLGAAVLARSERRPIVYTDVLAGLTAEMRKLGRQLPQELRTEEA